MSRRDDINNRANQMNPNNDAYWEARGFDERPDDWEDQRDRANASGEDANRQERRAGGRAANR